MKLQRGVERQLDYFLSTIEAGVLYATEPP